MADMDTRPNKGPRMTIEVDPVEETPKPIVDAPKPVVEVPEPVAETPKPGAEAPKPVVEAPTVAQAPAEPPVEPAKPRVKVITETPTPVEEPQPQPAQAPVTTTTVDAAPNESAQAAAAPVADESTGAEEQAAPTEKAPAQKPSVSVRGWVHQTFPGHEYAFWGAVIAVFIALFVFIIGPWRALFLTVLVVMGIAIGQVLDGDPKIIRTIRELFDSDRSRR